MFEERLAAFEKEYAAGRKRREARAAALRAIQEEQEAVKAGKRKPRLTDRRKRPGKGWGWVDQEQVGSGPGAEGVDVQDDVPGGWVPPDVYKELKDEPTWTPEEPSSARMFAALAVLHDMVLPTEPPILNKEIRESAAIRSLQDEGRGAGADFGIFDSGPEFTYSGMDRMRHYLYEVKAELAGKDAPKVAAVSPLVEVERQPPPAMPGESPWVQYDWLSKEAAILKRGYFDARERYERYSRIPDGAGAEKGAVEKKLHSADRWEDLEQRRLRLAERCRTWMPDMAEALPELSRPHDEHLDQGATEGELKKIEVEARSRFDADFETRSGQYPVSRALKRLRANLNLALLQFLLIGEEDGKYPTDKARAEYRDAHTRAREICRRSRALPALPAPVNDPQRDLRGLYDWCGNAMARWRLSNPTDSEDAPAAAAPKQGEGKAGSPVPILCPYDGPLAAALRRSCPNVKETHDELGSLRDYEQRSSSNPFRSSWNGRLMILGSPSPTVRRRGRACGIVSSSRRPPGTMKARTRRRSMSS